MIDLLVKTWVARPEKFMPILWLAFLIATILFCALEVISNIRQKNWRMIGLGLIALLFPVYMAAMLIMSLPSAIID